MHKVIRLYASKSSVRECVCVRRFICMSCREAAEELGVSWHMLLRWECGDRLMPYKLFRQYRNMLAKYFDKFPFIERPDMTDDEKVRWQMWKYKITGNDIARQIHPDDEVERERLRRKINNHLLLKAKDCAELMKAIEAIRAKHRRRRGKGKKTLESEARENERITETEDAGKMFTENSGIGNEVADEFASNTAAYQGRENTAGNIDRA